MTEALALVDNGEALPGIVSDNSYLLPPGLTFERWAGIGVTLQQMQRSINWWVGDWLRYGEDRFGEAAYQAVKAVTGHGDEAIRKAVWVASRFPGGTRVPTLSWSHHRAVLLDDLPIEEARSLLTEAATEIKAAADRGEERHVPVREIADRARARVDVIRAEALSATSEPVCAADAPWRPGIGDLTDEARSAMAYRAEEARMPLHQFAAGWIAALRWADIRDAFREWRDD